MSEEPQAASESASAATRAARRVEDPRDTVEGYCCGNKSVKNWQARFQPVPLASTIGWFQRRSVTAVPARLDSGATDHGARSRRGTIATRGFRISKVGGPDPGALTARRRLASRRSRDP